MVFEFNVLLKTSDKELLETALPAVVRAIVKLKQGEVIKEPGQDGLFNRTGILNRQLTAAGQELLFQKYTCRN